MTSEEIEFGLDTFAFVTVDESGQPLSGDVVIRNTVEEAVLADAVGIDSFNIGEHYRPELMDSANHVMLAAIAGRTEHIRLGTAVTVLSTQDPVRVYTDFATLDAVSDGRAQLIVGRGSRTDSFPLFGFDLADYETLFEEKLDLLTRLLRDQPVTWAGTARSPLTDQYVSPPLPPGHLPTWVGVGGSAESVIRAARYGLPLMLAIIGGHPRPGGGWGGRRGVGAPRPPLGPPPEAAHHRGPPQRVRPPRRALRARTRRVRTPAATRRDALARVRRYNRRGSS